MEARRFLYIVYFIEPHDVHGHMTMEAVRTCMYLRESPSQPLFG
jgi:hypothetical protein